VSLTPCLQVHWQGLLWEHQEQRRIKQQRSGWLFNIFVVLILPLQRDLVQPFLMAEDAS